jgi:hypothetical protein
MWLLQAYLLFATTTALAGIYELIYPVVEQLKHTHPDLPVIKYSGITYIASFMLIFAAAIVFFPVVLVPSMGNTFKTSLHKSLIASQE